MVGFQGGLNLGRDLEGHFAGHLVEDSQHRFQLGDWVRSSRCTALSDGVFFETRNTVYVVLGQGHEQTASFKAIFSFISQGFRLGAPLLRDN